jgi:hypothetical protein
MQNETPGGIIYSYQVFGPYGLISKILLSFSKSNNLLSLKTCWLERQPSHEKLSILCLIFKMSRKNKIIKIDA